jgi:hypothetical protein
MHDGHPSARAQQDNGVQPGVQCQTMPRTAIGGNQPSLWKVGDALLLVATLTVTGVKIFVRLTVSGGGEIDAGGRRIAGRPRRDCSGPRSGLASSVLMPETAADSVVNSLLPRKKVSGAVSSRPPQAARPGDLGDAR